MNTPLRACEPETDALGGDLRPCEISPRPILRPRKRSTIPIEGQR
jgi:hypothetical protein